MRCFQQFEYSQIGRELMPWEMTRLMASIQSSKVFEIADELPIEQLSHVVLKGTARPIGYLGADNQVELVNPEDNSSKIPHAYFERLYEDCLDVNRRLIL